MRVVQLDRGTSSADSVNPWPMIEGIGWLSFWRQLYSSRGARVEPEVATARWLGGAQSLFVLRGRRCVEDGSLRGPGLRLLARPAFVKAILRRS